MPLLSLAVSQLFKFTNHIDSWNMKSLRDLLFLDQKIGILQAADEFQFQLDKARAEFDFTAALNSIGSSALGTKYFYDRSVSLLRWIYIHPIFTAIMDQHIRSGYRGKAGMYSVDLQSSFFNLQLVCAAPLLTVLKSTNGAMLNFKLEHRLGIDILRSVVNAKPEQCWMDLFVEGFSERYPSKQRRGDQPRQQF